MQFWALSMRWLEWWTEWHEYIMERRYETPLSAQWLLLILNTPSWINGVINIKETGDTTQHTIYTKNFNTTPWHQYCSDSNKTQQTKKRTCRDLNKGKRKYQQFFLAELWMSKHWAKQQQRTKIKKFHCAPQHQTRSNLNETWKTKTITCKDSYATKQNFIWLTVVWYALIQRRLWGGVQKQNKALLWYNINNKPTRTIPNWATTLHTCKNNALIQQIIMGTNITIHCIKFYHLLGVHYLQAHDIHTKSALWSVNPHTPPRCTGFLLYLHKVPTTIICGLYNGYHRDITKYNMPWGHGSEKKGNSVRT